MLPSFQTSTQPSSNEIAEAADFGCLRQRHQMMSKNVGERGVTLMEMMVVLAIMAIVAAMIIPNVIGRPDEARVTVARADLQSIAASLKMYRLDNQNYPTTSQGLTALVSKPTSGPKPTHWNAEGYLAQVPVDPWNHPYVYRAPGEHAAFDLLSLGADGKPGGEGVDADLTHDGR